MACRLLGANQCWFIFFYKTLVNKFEWNWNKKNNNFYARKYIWKCRLHDAAIFSWPQCVETSKWDPVLRNNTNLYLSMHTILPPTCSVDNIPTLLHWSVNIPHIGNLWLVIHTVECRYNSVQYYKTLYTSLKWRGQNINHRSDLQKTHHISP